MDKLMINLSVRIYIMAPSNRRTLLGLDLSYQYQNFVIEPGFRIH